MRAALLQSYQKFGDKLRAATFLAPSLFGVLGLYLVPFVVVGYYALIDSPVTANFVFLRNFERVLSNVAFQIAAQNTLLFSVTAVPLAVGLALLLAVLLEQRIPMKSQLRTFFLSPLMVPVASIVLIWQVLFHHNGAVNELLAGIGNLTGWFTFEPINWFASAYNQIPIIILFLWRNLGYNMILFLAALANIPRELLEFAKLEGAGAPRIFFTVKMRYLSPTLVFVTILSLINSFRVFREVYLLTGPIPYGRLYMLQHYMNNMFRGLDYQSLAAAAIIMGVVMVAIIGIIFLVENRYGKDVEG